MTQGQLKDARAYRKQVWNHVGANAALMQRHLKQHPHDDPRQQDHSWLMPSKAAPGSMTDEEGMLIYELIRSNGLKNGFELCTGFGYSAMFAAMAMRETGGKLKTLDCYIEEWKESWLYHGQEVKDALHRVQKMIQEGKNPEGLALAKKFAKELNLSDFVEFHLGVSPEAIPNVLADQKVDYVLIDGGHDGDQPLLDWQAMKPFLADRCAIVFHDSHPYAHPVRRAIKDAEDYLGIPAVHLKTRWALSVIGRNLNPTTLPTLEELCLRASPRPISEQIQVFGRKVKRKLGRLVAKIVK